MNWFKNDNYEIFLLCKNCEDNRSYKISKGTLAEDFAKEQTCQNCGCKTIEVEKEDEN